MATDTDTSGPVSHGPAPAWAGIDRWIAAFLSAIVVLAVVGVTWANAGELYSRCLDEAFFRSDPLRNLINITDRNSFVYLISQPPFLHFTLNHYILR